MYWWTGITKGGKYSSTIHASKDNIISLCGRVKVSGDSLISERKCKRCLNSLKRNQINDR